MHFFFYPFTNVRSIIKTADGDLWWGGNDGLWRYDGHNFEQLGNRFVGYIYQDRSGNIWTSESDRSEVYDMTLYKYTFDPLPLKNVAAEVAWEGPGQVFGIIEDAKGDIWFGTERGVEVLNDNYE